MSVTVKKAVLDREPAWENVGGTHRLIFSVCLTLDMVWMDGTNKRIVAQFMPGFRCDGLSVPRIIRWFLKSWDSSNELYNMAGAIHDWLYATKGFTHLFSREECDDIFRGLLRIAGISRGKAGVADKAVEWFAGGKAHWGNDDYGVKNLVLVSVA